MANLSITAANVAIASLSQVRVVQVGESVTQGQALYLKASDGKYWKADANASAATAAARGIALSPASTDGYVVLHDRPGDFVNLGATLTAGETYVVSATAGAICPIADLTTGDYVTILGSATTSALIKTIYTSTGAQK